MCPRWMAFGHDTKHTCVCVLTLSGPGLLPAGGAPARGPSGRRWPSCPGRGAAPVFGCRCCSLLFLDGWGQPNGSTWAVHPHRYEACRSSGSRPHDLPIHIHATQPTDGKGRASSVVQSPLMSPTILKRKKMPDGSCRRRLLFCVFVFFWGRVIA